ncbi:MAG: endonuclease, partial [Acidobacteriota bacterium]
MTAVVRHVVVGMMLVLGPCLGAAAPDLPLSAETPQPLGEWSTDCNPGFRLSAMPSAWSFFPGQESLVVTVRPAIDFERLSTDVYTVTRDHTSGERVFELTGFDFMVLEAEIRHRKTGRVVEVLSGVYLTDNGKEPVVFEWDGRLKDGSLVKAGFYEVEVRGRFVPVWAGVRVGDGYGYRDFGGWSIVEEACRRIVAVEVKDKAVRGSGDRGISCAAPPASYYSTVDAIDAATLRSTLHPVIDDHTRFPYSSTSTDCWDILNDADENPSNTSQLLSIYKNEAYADGCSSGCDSSLGWNREHTWAKSFGFSEDTGNGRIPYTDCHHLRAADQGYNSSRGNKLHNDCTVGCTDKPTDFNNGFGGTAGEVNKGSGGSTSCGFTPNPGDVWETWDHRKGDVARTILYMDIRYEGGVGEQDLIATSDLALMMVETTTCGDGYQDPAYHGVLSTLLTWHAADPVDSDEQRRNDQVWCYQGNRNPFVDHPEWVDCLYNNICSGGPAFGGIDSAVDLDACADTGVQIDWTLPTDWNDSCSSGCSRGFTISRDGVAILSGGCAGSLSAATVSCVDTTGTNSTMVTYRVEAFNDDGDATDGGATADAGDFIDDALGPVITTGPSAQPSSASFTATWTTDEPSDSFLEWGLSSGSYTANTSDAADVTSHSLTATGLSITTPYFYRVCSTDPCGNGPTCSAEATVTTTGECDPGDDTPVFINELHYDNDGTDTGEFVEIAGPAGTDLSGWSIAVYNGNGGGLSGNMSPNPVSISGSIDDEGAGYGAVFFAIAGIENGAPDGLALVNNSGTVIQFLSYEGSFTATAGPAEGLTSTDIGVSESSSTLVGDSLQLKGGPGFVYEGFSWTAPSAESPGSINAGQDMSCWAPPDQLQFFTATSTSGQVLLEWENSVIYPTGGTTRICRDPAAYPTDPATCTIAGTQTEQPGSDGSYGSFIDSTALTNGSTYFYSAWVVNSSGEASARKTVSARPFDTAGSAKWSYHSAASSLAPPGLWPGAVGTGAVFVVANDNNL